VECLVLSSTVAGAVASPWTFYFQPARRQNLAQTLQWLALQLPPREFGTSVMVTAGPRRRRSSSTCRRQRSLYSGHPATRKGAQHLRYRSKVAPIHRLSERHPQQLVFPGMRDEGDLSPAEKHGHAAGRRRSYPLQICRARISRGSNIGSSEDFAQRYPPNPARATKASRRAASPSVQDLLNCAAGFADSSGGSGLLRFRERYVGHQRRSMEMSCAIERVGGSFARQARTRDRAVGGASGWLTVMGSGSFSRWR